MSDSRLTSQCLLPRLPGNSRGVSIVLFGLLVCALPGCSRMFWRTQADFDTYNQLLQKTQDPRWDLPRVTVDPDPRSRFYDPFDPDVTPLPPDDPAAHQYMHWVDGMRGYKNWHKFGDAPTIESPYWADEIPLQPDYAHASWESPGKPLPEDVASGAVVDPHMVPTIENLTLEQAIELSAIHNRDYQFQIENVYLSALALTFDQFQFNVRYLGLGNREPTSGLTYFNTPSVRDDLAFNNRFGVSQLLPTGGQWVAELANNTLWLFQGQNQANSSSVLTYQLTQPLLLGAGRKVVLEDLTQSERAVLYDVRALARFRKIFFANIVSGSNVGNVGGFLQLLQQQQQMLNQRNNIRLTRVQVERVKGQNAIPPGVGLPTVPADLAIPGDPPGLRIPPDFADRMTYLKVLKELRWEGPMTSTERDRLLDWSPSPVWQAAIGSLYSRAQFGVIPQTVSQLLTQLADRITQLRTLERNYLDSVDSYKLQLGLPTDFQLTINNRILKQFELIDPRIQAVEQSLLDYQQTDLSPIDQHDPELPMLRSALDRLTVLRHELQTQAIDVVANDLQRVDDALPTRLEKLRDPRDREVAQQDLERNRLVFREVILDMYRETGDALTLQRERLAQENLSADERFQSLRAIDNAREDLLQISQNLQSVQAGLRCELIELQDFDLTQDEVIRLAMEHRLDLMNQRGAVMDARRQLEVAANRLEAVLDLVARGDLRNSGGNNPVDFRGDRSTFQAGVQFTAPLDQVQERNNYRAALINYQRERRSYMELEDAIKLQVRREWRFLQSLKANFETSRQNLRISAIQLDNTIELTNAPGAGGQAAGAGGGGGQNQGLNLINALNSILSAQNNLISIWAQYEQNRINIYKDMDIMNVDERGLWDDPVYQNLPPGDAVPPTSLIEPADDHLRPTLLSEFTRELGTGYLVRRDQRLALRASAGLPLAASADHARHPDRSDGGRLPVPVELAADRATPPRAVRAVAAEPVGAPDRGAGDGARQAGAVPDHGHGTWHARQHEERRADQ
jgi:hypothetical protein